MSCDLFLFVEEKDVWISTDEDNIDSVSDMGYTTAADLIEEDEDDEDEDDDGKSMVEDSIAVEVRQSILKNIANLSIPISQRKAISKLLTLKQNKPHVFIRKTLYEDICKTMDNYVYSMDARQFVFSLFDTSLIYDQAISQPWKIV